MSDKAKQKSGPALGLACFLVILTYGLMIDLKGVDVAEGIRLGIMNGGREFNLNEPATTATWPMVIKAGFPYAYQPLYYLLQNTVMRVAQSRSEILLRMVNVFFLWVSLQGLLALSKDWRLLPRLFLIGVFSFNAYLIMHVLTIREYIAGLAFYIWSTWLVLQLDARELRRKWADLSWFAAYGALLALGFYLQSWVVFPAIGQFLFLLVRRGRAKARFYAHLALSYLIVLAATVPFLRLNPQRVNVGHWGNDASKLAPQLADGFHAVLAGHLAGHSLFTDFLFWFWLAVIAGAGLLLLSNRSTAGADMVPAEFRRQGGLMVLSIVIPLAFQVVYFFTVDTLSVWTHYFIIHYFFLFWLVALAFNYLDHLGHTRPGSSWPRRGLKAAAGTAFAVMLVSGIYQTRSYYQNPFEDTGMSEENNWRTVAAAMSRILEPGDLVLTQDFLHSWTLTYTRPIPNRVIPVQGVDAGTLASVPRCVYLEPSATLPLRGEISSRLNALGFETIRETGLSAADGKGEIPEWRVLIFKRR